MVLVKHLGSTGRITQPYMLREKFDSVRTTDINKQHLEFLEVEQA